MPAVETIRLGSKCRMVLPMKLRKALGVSEGSELLALLLGNTVVLVPKPTSYADRLLGLYGDIWARTNPEGYLAEERNSWED
ncbi:MAG: AbrB/MazE/SpoVT family DNA-binding domain-containing protein [Bacillota bacterium]